MPRNPYATSLVSIEDETKWKKWIEATSGDAGQLLNLLYFGKYAFTFRIRALLIFLLPNKKLSPIAYPEPPNHLFGNFIREWDEKILPPSKLAAPLKEAAAEIAMQFLPETHALGFRSGDRHRTASYYFDLLLKLMPYAAQHKPELKTKMVKSLADEVLWYHEAGSAEQAKLPPLVIMRHSALCDFRNPSLAWILGSNISDEVKREADHLIRTVVIAKRKHAWIEWYADQITEAAHNKSRIERYGLHTSRELFLDQINCIIAHGRAKNSIIHWWNVQRVHNEMRGTEHRLLRWKFLKFCLTRNGEISYVRGMSNETVRAMHQEFGRARGRVGDALRELLAWQTQKAEREERRRNRHVPVTRKEQRAEREYWNADAALQA